MIYQNLRPDVYNWISSSRGRLNWHRVVENYGNPLIWGIIVQTKGAA